MLIGHINGREVYSDKEVGSIENGRIFFVDGSWCDTQTGQIVNHGQGFISFDAPATGTGQNVITKGPNAYQAQGLSVTNLHAEIDIKVGPTYGVEITGPEAEVEGIQVKVVDGILVVHGHSSRGNRSSGNIFMQGDGNIISSGRGSVSMGKNSSNNVIITGDVRGDVFRGDKTSRRGGDTYNISGQVGSIGPGSVSSNSSQMAGCQIRIMVLKGAPIILGDVGGTVRIGDTEGALSIDTQGSSVITVGRVGGTNLQLQGSPEIEIAELNGPLSATLQGSAEVEVKKGRLSSVVVSAQGSSEMKINGTADTANLSASGSAEIYLAKSNQRPLRSRSGSADIEVGNW